MVDEKSLVVTPEEMRYSWLLQSTAIEQVLRDEDAGIHVAYIYTIEMIKFPPFKIRKDGTPDRRDNRGRLVVKLARVLRLKPLQFVKEPDGTWIWKEWV
jgi:hypothetical protein